MRQHNLMSQLWFQMLATPQLETAGLPRALVPEVRATPELETTPELGTAGLPRELPTPEVRATPESAIVRLRCSRRRPGNYCSRAEIGRAWGT